MKLFDKKFVHFMWDDELKGKKCFVRDCIDDLVDVVEKGGPEVPCEVEYSGKPYSPFQIYSDGRHFNYIFAYYDPNYEVKKAFNEGKKVQVYDTAADDWVDCDEPLWCKDCLYRVKPEEEKWIAYLARENDGSCYLSACLDSYWRAVQKEFSAKTKLFIGTHDEVSRWFELRQKFAEVIKAWENGEQIQFRRFSDWLNVSEPIWDFSAEYRVKPKEKEYRPYTSSAEMTADFKARFKVNCPAYAEPLIWVKGKETGSKFLVFAFYETFIKFNDDEPLMFKELFDAYTYLDGSLCGMKE